jgi:TctA family transporter
MSGIVVMLVFGFVGVIMTYLRWPRPPLILGLVLGGLAEKYYGISVSRYGYEWLMFPSVLIILSVALCALVYPVANDLVRSRRSVSRSGRSATPPPTS